MKKIEPNPNPLMHQHLERTKRVKWFRSQEVKHVSGKEWPILGWMQERGPVNCRFNCDSDTWKSLATLTKEVSGSLRAEVILEGTGRITGRHGRLRCPAEQQESSRQVRNGPWKDFLKIKDGRRSVQFSSVQSSHSVMSSSLQSHWLQHNRLPCPSPTPWAYLNSSPFSQWCLPTISSSVVSSTFRLQSFPASGSFQKSQFFTSGRQSIWVSASASVVPVNIQDWFSLG